MIEQFSLYEGKTILTFDDKKHTYTVNNKIVYGTTSIVGIINKPQLMYWAVNQAVDFLRINLAPGKSYDEIELKGLLDDAKYQHSKSKNKAGDVGTMIHDWISEFLKAGMAKKPLPKKPVNPEMRNAVDSFLDWTKKHKVKFLSSERRIFSKKYNYAGTLDAEAKIDGKLYVVDFKTSNAIYPEYFLQTSAYQQARQEEGKKKYAGSFIIRLSKKDKQKGIEAFEARESKDFKLNIKTFLACLDVYKWQMLQKKAEIINKLN